MHSDNEEDVIFVRICAPDLTAATDGHRQSGYEISALLCTDGTSELSLTLSRASWVALDTGQLCWLPQPRRTFCARR